MQLSVNGEAREVDCGPADSLLGVLRDGLGLTAAKLACGRGECGACTVLIDGRPRMSCITPVGVAGAVTTLEGLVEESADLRAEFAERGAFQCGFCTPGHVVHATALLRGELPADEQGRRAVVRHSLNGNVCRCTGYQAIVEAVCAIAVRRAEARA
ncbi:(2Fe-2S)-binding protein [Dactylosporangium sp. CA-092794]|uniref:(2Fe-2S)-binding protein n=1 Tax=Dactylosporangium sp. CA-092794 TaxID=3239929 RepID=UPI003D915DF6